MEYGFEAIISHIAYQNLVKFAIDHTNRCKKINI